jgi:hypothetical protein
MAVACGDDVTEFEDDGGGGSGAEMQAGAGASGGSGGIGGMILSVGGSSGTGSGGTGDCTESCGIGFKCCNGDCINPANDILNCGQCGKVCDGDQPFCDDGTCGSPPCDGGTTCVGTQFCCGANCCELGQLCCVVPVGPVQPPTCYDPVDGTCPKGSPGSVCAHPDTPIATPDGERRIASLRPGDLVYSVVDGAVEAVPLARVSQRAVRNHRVVRISLDSGRELFISPLHPTADGRTVGDLRAGDELFGVGVTAVELVDFEEEYTHDILPASATGAYFAAGALMGSTLR